MSIDEIYQMSFATYFLTDFDDMMNKAAAETAAGLHETESDAQAQVKITSIDELVLVISSLTTYADNGLDSYKSKANLIVNSPDFSVKAQNMYNEGFANLNTYDTGRLEGLICWITEAQTVIGEHWNCPKQNIMSELIQIFSPLGITVPILKACLTYNVDDVKEAMGSDVINVDIDNALSQHSIAMLMQIYAESRNIERLEEWQTENRLILDDETVKRMNLILSIYRDFIEYTETYIKEYKDFLSRFIALNCSGGLCTEKNPDKALLLDFVHNKLYWKSLLWSYFNMIQPSSTTPIYTKEIILTLLENCADKVEDEYTRFCDENNIASHDRLPLLLTNNEESETPLKKASKKPLKLDEVLKKGRPYFDKAVEKGLMVKISDNEYKWKGVSKSLLTYFCGRIYCGDYTCSGGPKEHDIWEKGDNDYRIPNLELNQIFEEEINLTNLRSSRLGNGKPTSPSGHKIIDQIIDEVNQGL